MDAMLDRLMRRIPDAGAGDRAILSDILEDAGRTICAYTLRDAVPESLEAAQIQLAVVMFNRMGMEGETIHDEGGVSRRAESMPEDILRQLRPWRRVRTVSK